MFAGVAVAGKEVAAMVSGSGGGGGG